MGVRNRAVKLLPEVGLTKESSSFGCSWPRQPSHGTEKVACAYESWRSGSVRSVVDA
jgi:hypothetical protein